VAETINEVTGDETAALQSALAGRYTVERELGRGGMGVVYLARDLTLDRLVAIKLLPPVFAAQSDLRQRFLRETRTAASLSHPNIVPIYAVEERQGMVFFAMGYVDGETLTQRVRRAGPLPPGEVARVLQEAAWGLSYAHGRGIVHRDVKPDNILIERGTGRAFITDFGIARVANAATMTSVGESLGTPHFMSPEQAAGEPLDARSDLYSLGVVGFFALTGQLPFDAPTVQAVLAMHLTRPAPPVASLRPGVPAKLAAAVERLLAKEPSARFATGEALVDAIQAAHSPTVDVAPPVRSFTRAGELLVTQLIVVTVMLWSLARLHAPDPSKVMTLWGLFVVIAVTQLVSRARTLVDDGFGYDDVRAVFAAEAREREEAMAAARGRRISRQRFLIPGIVGLVGILLVTSGLVIGIPSTHGTTQNRIGWILLYSGMVLFILGLSSALVASPRFAQRQQRLIGRLWMGVFGRAVFRVALALRPKFSAAATVPAPGTSGASPSLTGLIAALPAGARRPLGDAARVIGRLEETARALERREQELDQALAEAVGGGLPNESSAGDGSNTLRLRREQVATELRTARADATGQRGAVLDSLERLRLQLVRLRSGLGTPADMAAEVEEARRVLEGRG
jgi:serine/threonine-protein kinase